MRGIRVGCVGFYLKVPLFPLHFSALFCNIKKTFNITIFLIYNKHIISIILNRTLAIEFHQVTYIYHDKENKFYKNQFCFEKKIQFKSIIDKSIAVTHVKSYKSQFDVIK